MGSFFYVKFLGEGTTADGCKNLVSYVEQCKFKQGGAEALYEIAC